MKITVRYFASLREAIGQSQEDLHTLASHAGEVRDELLARGGAYACLSRDRSVRLALNQAMVEEDALLQENAELAFFPPVTGG
jgi:molybdopterin synthase sulfur carrier subunit